jgi:hypothetical protein
VRRQVGRLEDLSGTGAHTAPALLDDPRGHRGLQRFPDISVDAGSAHVLWWDSRNDPCFDPRRPVGNCADRSTVPALDVFATQASTATLAWSPAVRVSDVTSNPNYEQYGCRAVPFDGDYLYISSVGAFSYGVWTDWRNVGLAAIHARAGTATPTTPMSSSAASRIQTAAGVPTRTRLEHLRRHHAVTLSDWPSYAAVLELRNERVSREATLPQPALQAW